METIETLPDELPVSYKSWLHFYLDTKKNLEKYGAEINEKTIVKYRTINHEKHESITHGVLYEREWPLIAIKARALDYVLSKMPTFNQIIELSYDTPYNLRDAIEGLVDITQPLEND